MTDTTPSKPVLILGAGGHGQVVAQAVLASGRNVLGFLDDDKQKLGQTLEGFSILGDSNDAPDLLNQNDASLIVAIGDNQQRHLKLFSLLNANLEITTVIHPSAVVAPNTIIGLGTVIMPLAVVNTGAEIAQGVIVNSSSVIEHNVKLGVCAHVSPRAVIAGDSVVLDRVWVGAGAVVKEGLTLGTDAIVGAGAVVLEDVALEDTVVGIPAKSIRTS